MSTVCGFTPYSLSINLIIFLKSQENVQKYIFTGEIPQVLSLFTVLKGTESTRNSQPVLGRNKSRLNSCTVDTISCSWSGLTQQPLPFSLRARHWLPLSLSQNLFPWANMWRNTSHVQCAFLFKQLQHMDHFVLNVMEKKSLSTVLIKDTVCAGRRQ